MKLFRERLAEIPSLLVDTGHFMSDERNAHAGLRPDVVVKDDWVLKAYSEFPVDVANVSSHDLLYFSRLLSKREFARRSESESLLKRLVSANTVSESPGLLAPRPFIIREIPLRQDDAAKAGRVRVAFIGLTEAAPAPPPGLKFIDSAEAVRRTVPEARKNADIVVVLAKVNAEEAVRIARGAVGIDVILAGNGVANEQVFTPPLYVGKTLIAFTPYETRMIGELRFYRNGQGRYSTKQRFISLDETLVPPDPAAKQLADRAQQAEAEARTTSKSLMEDWLAKNRTSFARKAPEPDLPAAYVGSSSCSHCHTAQYVKWANSRHARAIDPLLTRWVEFEAKCLECHATGAKPQNGKNLEGLQAVQCEQCHGPGSIHSARPAKGYGRIANVLNACTDCHTAEISPRFDLQAAWAKIKH